MAGLDPLAMDDTGMWIWAGVLTAIGLVASFFLAVLWQRWKDSKKKEA